MPDYPSSTEFAEGVAPPERLADRLAQGQLPIDQVLGCAADLALRLKELHAAGQAHGAVTPVFVGLEPTRAVLLPAAGSESTATRRGDVTAFGSLLYEMLTERKPAAEGFANAVRRCPYGPGWADVYESALRVAEKCLAADANALPNFQNIASELRLLLVIARGPAVAPASVAERPRQASKPAATPAAVEEAEDPSLTLTDLECPRCGADDVHFSARRTGFERFLARFDVSLFRCHRCFHRFMVIFGVRIPMAGPE